MLKTLEAPHTCKICCLAQSPDGSTLVSGASDGIIRTWDVLTGNPLLCLEHDASLTDIELTDDGRIIIASDLDANLTIWDATSGAKIKSFKLDSFMNFVVVNDS